MNEPVEFPVDRGSDDDQKRWVAELYAAAASQHFPPGGSFILAESPAQAQAIVDELTANGHRAIARGIYIRTILVFPKERQPVQGSLDAVLRGRDDTGEL